MNVNYEDDANTMIKQMQFPKEWKPEDMPIDFALCRYLAVEHGVACMPIMNFCLQESPYRTGNFIRIAICKKPEVFKSEKIHAKFGTL